MRKTRILTMLLALIMVLGMLPVGVFAAEEAQPAVTAENLSTAQPQKSAEQASAGNVIDGWQSYSGSTWLSNGDSCLNVSSQTNPGTVFFADRKFENYEMEMQMQLNDGPWFGVMYRAIGDEKGFFLVRPGASGAHSLSHHVTLDGDGWQSDSVSAESGYPAYTTGTVMNVKVRVENNQVSVWTKMTEDADYYQEFNNVAVPENLQGAGYVGICMQYSDVTILSANIRDLDSDYTYTSNFAPVYNYDGSWGFYRGSGSPTVENGVVKPNISAYQTLYIYKNVKWTNYVLEAELAYYGNYAGIVFRGCNSNYGYYYLSGEGTAIRGIGWFKNDSDASANTLQKNIEGTQYNYGDRVRIRITMQDNLLTVEEKVVGKDAEWVKTVDAMSLTETAPELGSTGMIGFYSRKGADLTIYNLKITDTDTGYDAKLIQQQGVWAFDKGSGSPVTENNVIKPNISTFDTLYKLKGLYWDNMVLETEISYKANYSGVVFRGNGAYHVYYGLSGASTSARSFKLLYKDPDKSNLSGTVLQDVEASTYTSEDRIKLRITIQNNLLTIEEMIVGVDADWVKTVDNFSLTENAPEAGFAGEIGFYSRKGTDLTIYNLKVTDTDTGYCYKAIEPVGEWIFESGSGSPTIENGVLKPNISTYTTFYKYSNANWDNFVWETEISYNAQYAGLVFRGNEDYNGYYSIAKAGADTSRSLSYWTLSSDEGTKLETVTNGSQYTYGKKIKLRVTVKDNLLTIEEKIEGTDTDWVKTVDKYSIADNASFLGTAGSIGYYTRSGSKLAIYSLKITDTDTGFTYNMLEQEPVINTDSVSFDGNHVIDTSAPLAQTPDTIEVWFKTDKAVDQALLCTYWSAAKNNEYYLSITETGRLYYQEDNPDTKMADNVDFRVLTKTGFNDGKWHKAVVRRYYDAASGLLKVDLSVFTDNKLVARSTQTNVIGDTKLSQYENDGGKFITNRIMQIGTRKDNRYVLTGEIGEIRMWDSALSDDEIASDRIALDGTEAGLLHCFVPENGTNFVDLVTSKTDSEITADMAELWMENYVIGEADWRIAVLPDIQHNTEAYEIQLRNYFTWIRDNAEKYNIKLVVSVGDMVNTCTPEQMHTASEAASVLDGVVPFMPLMGNHDYPVHGRDSMLWNEYFPYEKYSQYDYFGGAFEEGKMDNYYYLMNINGEDYLFMALEVAVRPAVAQWAGEVFAAHPNHKVIITNHIYLDADSKILPGGRSASNGRFKSDGLEATELYDCLISKHDNIVLTISGHVHHYLIGRRTDVTESGHTVNSIGFDTAQIERYYGTAGMVGLVGFTGGSNTVKVNNYSTEREQFFKSTDQFEIELDWNQEYPGKPAEPEILVDDTMADKIAAAKEALYSGNANAYVAIAGAANTVVTHKTYAADAVLNVFGQEVSAWYAEGGNVYVHVLALGAAKTVTLQGQTDVMVQTNAFASGDLEVVTPANINRSRYDFLLHNWNVTITGNEQIGVVSNKAVGENTIIYFNGAYHMVAVSNSLKRNVALIDVAGENLSSEIALIEGDTFSSANIQITCQKTITIDGDLSDWNENILATGRTMTGTGTTSHKNVTFYAYMADEGLYVAALANHEKYVDNASLWYNNTNLEFYLNGESSRYWLTANPACFHADVQDEFKTQLNNGVYTTVAEGFIAMEDLPENARSGEIKIGFAWKTPGDKIKYYNMTSGKDWWYLTRRNPSTIVEQYYANTSGVGLYSHVRTLTTIELDGDFSDFNAQALENKLSIRSQDGTVGFDAYAQYEPGYGVYVGVKAQSKTNPRPDALDHWYNNTNLEFYIGENRYYITNRGAAAGNGMYGKNVYWHQTYDEATGLYDTIIEFFVPVSALGTVNNEDYLRMGFAFKPTGESVLLNGHTEATDFWHMAGHGPSDTENQFYVYKNGIHLQEQENYVSCAAIVNGVEYDTVQAAVDAANGGVVKLGADSNEEITAQGDLYIDLNGYSLKKVTVTGTLYGMDSATNDYTASNAKIETVEGNYAAHYRNVDAKRYLAIAEENGVSFHRFYMGITTVSLDTAVTGFGYKAEFYGDEAVQAQIASVGYNLWITEDRVVTRTADFKNVLTLRLKNYDVVNYGETPVNANAMITLNDGTVIESATTAYSMRQMMEQVAADFNLYKVAQKKAVQTLCQSYEIMQSWNIAAILNWTDGAYLTTNYFTESLDGAYTLTTNSDAVHLVDDVMISDEIMRETNYSLKGKLTLTNADTWGQARILVSADPNNEYLFALEKVNESKYQIFTMSKSGEESWHDWALVDHSEQNGNRNALDFEVLVIGDALYLLIDDQIYYTANRVSMPQSTVKFSGYNTATTTVSNLALEVFADEAAAQTYAATKESRYGENFGSSQRTYWTTNGVDVSADKGENPTISITGGAPQYAYWNDVYADTFTMETEVNVQAVLNNDGYPKFGLLVKGETEMVKFYVDMTPAMTATRVGVVHQPANEADDWANAKSVEVPGMSFTGNDTIKLKLVREGQAYSFYVNDVLVLSEDAGLLAENGAVGIFSFNTQLTASNYNVIA